MLAPILQSCAVGVDPCNDTGGGEVGVPGWVLVGGSLLLVAAFVAVVVVLLLRANRRAPRS